jgi:hypothetical protein
VPIQIIYGYKLIARIYVPAPHILQTNQAYRFFIQFGCETPGGLYADDAEWLVTLMGQKVFVIPQQQTLHLTRGKDSDKLIFSVEAEEAGYREAYLTVHDKRQTPPVELFQFIIPFGEFCA